MARTGGELGEHARNRDENIRGITESVQRIGWASDRIGHIFADTHQLHPTDFRALAAIFRAELAGKPLTGKGLAHQLQLSPAAITYVVDRLLASGHVSREQDTVDRRRLILRFADPGRQVAGAFFGPLGRAHAEALTEFDAEELAVARRVLATVVDTLNAFEEQLTESRAERPTR